MNFQNPWNILSQQHSVFSNGSCPLVNVGLAGSCGCCCCHLASRQNQTAQEKNHIQNSQYISPVGRCPCCQTRWPEFNPCHSNGGRRELNPKSCPLTSVRVMKCTCFPTHQVNKPGQVFLPTSIQRTVGWTLVNKGPFVFQSQPLAPRDSSW